MNMPLEQWEREVSYHLKSIEAAADMATAHAAQLPVRPDFESRAEDAMVRCVEELEGALEAMREALAAYRAKEVEQ
jgi:hypothetical protein